MKLRNPKKGAVPSDNGAANPLQAKFAAARAAMHAALVERDDEIDLVLTALIAREHCLFVGPPGTAKSLTLDTVMRWAGSGSNFSILLTKFTVPEEVFGPVDVAGLKDSHYRRITRGKLPEAEFAFLDEIFKGSSAILNTTLKILNERVFENNGDGPVKCPLRLCVAASNEWPGEENGGAELGALFDRFLFRKLVKPVSPSSGLRKLFNLARRNDPCHAKFDGTVTALELDKAHEEARALPWSESAAKVLREIIEELRKEGVTVGDRRFMKSVTAARAYAYLCGGSEVRPEHLAVLAHVLWDDPAEQPARCAKIVARFADHTGHRCGEIRAQADDAVDRCRPAEAVVKLQALAADAAELAGVDRADALVLAKSGPDGAQKVIDRAAEKKAPAKVVACLRHLATLIGDSYRKTIGS